MCLHVIAELGPRYYRPSNACYGHRSNSTATTGCSKGGHRILRRPPTASFRCKVFQNAPTVEANCNVDPQNLCSKYSLPLKFRFWRAGVWRALLLVDNCNKYWYIVEKIKQSTFTSHRQLPQNCKEKMSYFFSTELHWYKVLRRSAGRILLLVTVGF